MLLPELRDSAEKLGKFLGLEGPVSERVLKAATVDPLYAHHLLTCANQPVFLKALLASPPVSADVEAFSKFTLAEQAGHAAKAFAKWSKSGFKFAAKSVVDDRLRACESCLHLEMAGGAISATSRCGVCGCFVLAKARMSSENCPVASDASPDRSRWGHPLDE